MTCSQRLEHLLVFQSRSMASNATGASHKAAGQPQEYETMGVTAAGGGAVPASDDESWMLEKRGCQQR